MESTEILVVLLTSINISIVNCCNDKVFLMLIIIQILQSGVACQKNLVTTETNWQVELVLAHEDCNKFYKYFNGKPLEILCPRGLYFNVKYLQCDWKGNVACEGRRTPNDESDDEIPNNGESETDDVENEEIDADSDNEIMNTDLDFFENGCPLNPLIRWLLPHEDNCNQFYSCFMGIRVQRQCPPFLHFNRKHQVCDWPRAAGCAL